MTLLSSSVNAKLCSKFSLPQATQNTRRVESWFRFYVSEFLLFSVLNILLARVRLLLLTFVWTVNMLMAFISPSIASRQAAIREANRLRGRRSQFWLCFRGVQPAKRSPFSRKTVSLQSECNAFCALWKKVWEWKNKFEHGNWTQVGGVLRAHATSELSSLSWKTWQKRYEVQFWVYLLFMQKKVAQLVKGRFKIKTVIQIYGRNLGSFSAGRLLAPKTRRKVSCKG